MTVTCYVLEDGSVADPSEVKRDAAGVWRHRDGRAVAMRGDVPRSRSVETPSRDPQPAPRAAYLTRESTTGPAKPDDVAGDLSALRAAYAEKFGKRPFAGWDAAALREKLGAKTSGED